MIFNRRSITTKAQRYKLNPICRDHAQRSDILKMMLIGLLDAVIKGQTFILRKVITSVALVR